jgi:hypothetical protein
MSPLYAQELGTFDEMAEQLRRWAEAISAHVRQRRQQDEELGPDWSSDDLRSLQNAFIRMGAYFDALRHYYPLPRTRERPRGELVALLDALTQIADIYERNLRSASV